MLTPQDVTNREFDKAVFGGYDIAAVDKFLEEIFQDYSALYRDNATLKSKLKVLVDKVEEYRSTEDAMRKALHSAQKMADQLIQEGEAKKAAAIEAAVTEAQRQSDALRSQLHLQEEAEQAKLNALRTDVANERVRLEAARAATTAYVAKLKELYTQELTYIGSLSSLTAEDIQKQETAEPQTAPEGEAAEPGETPEPEKDEVFDQIQFSGDEEE